MQQVAQGLASLGRGNDTQLVHMTPGEVKGLQNLAMAHGGSLTINPHTGLPEAGFLENVLPMILTTAATIYGGPAAGAAVNGAITYRKTGDLQKSVLNAGITYGLGKFGEGAEAMGTTAPASVGAKITENALQEGAEAGAKTLAEETARQKALTESYNKALESQVSSQTYFPDGSVGPLTQSPLPSAPYFPFTPEQLAQDAIDPAAYESGTDLMKQRMENPLSARFSNTVEGIKQMGSKAGLKDIYGRMDKYALMGLGAGAASLMQPKPKAFTPPAQTPNRYANYKYTPMKWNPATGRYENGRYSDVDYSTTQRNAAGGQIQAPSMPLDLSQNYPGSNITKSSYATLPSTDSQEVVDGYGPKINPFTGAEGMATGGLAGGGYMDDKGNSSTYNDESWLDKLTRNIAPMKGDASGLGGAFRGAIDQVKAGDAFRPAPDEYVYDPATQQYVKKTPEMKMAMGGGIKGLKTGDAIYSDAAGAGPYSDAAGIGSYSDATGRGMYANTDAAKGLEAQIKKMSSSSLARYKKAKNAAMQAAAVKEEYLRAAAPNTEYEDTQAAANGGLMGLSEYAAGGKLLRGPGDGMSDDIPAVIKGQQPQRAALADGEFVIPADVVSHLGNGSTEAGAKRLYAMMDKVRHARTGRKAQGRQIKAEKYLPA